MVTEVLVEAMGRVKARPVAGEGRLHMAAEMVEPRLEVQDIAVDLFIAILLQDLDVIIGIKDLPSHAEEIADMEEAEEEEEMDGPAVVPVSANLQLGYVMHILMAAEAEEEAPDGLVQDGQIP